LLLTKFHFGTVRLAVSAVQHPFSRYSLRGALATLLTQTARCDKSLKYATSMRIEYAGAIRLCDESREPGEKIFKNRKNYEV
jgi:hypothetical protein